MDITEPRKDMGNQGYPSRIDDSQLPLLVSQAAIEFDCAIRGLKEVNFKAARKLGGILISFSGRGEQDQGSSDPIAIGLIALAAREVEAADTLRNDFADMTAELGQLLKKLDVSSSKWEFLRDFCGSFARQLVDYRQSLKLMQPENPNRR